MTIAVQNLTEAWEASLAIEGPEFDEVEDELDLIEADLMKKGTMAYFEIDWEQAYDHALKALKSGAHINAIAAGATALVQKGDVEEFTILAQHLSKLLGEQWDKVQPASARSEKLKKARTQELLDAIPKRLEKDPIDDAGFEAALNALVAAAKARGLETERLEALHISRPSTPEGMAEGETPAAPQAARIGGSAEPAGSFLADLDAKGRAQLKRDVVALAERIEAFRPKDPTPYYLRGFASTIEITTAPEADAEGKTQMNAMPREIADSFAHALSTPNAQGLKQIEQRLMNSPDWFAGQAIAAQMAEALDLPAIAAAIRHRVQNRLRALPEFGQIKYTNGEAFLNGKSREVLLQSAGGQTQNRVDGGDAELAMGLLDQLEEANQNSGLSAALDLLEKRTHAAHSEREKCTLALDRAEFLSKHGFAGLARDSLQILEMRFQSDDLRKWDQPLFERFEGLKSQLKMG